MTAMIAYLLVIGTLVAIAARASEEALRLAGKATRWPWAAALAFLAALTVRAPFTTVQPDGLVTLDATSLAAAAQPKSTSAPTLQALWATLEHARTALAEAPYRLVGLISDAVPAPVVAGLGATWLVMTAAALALLAVVYVRFGAAVRRLPTSELHGVRVRVSPDAGPAVIGLVRPEIVVPAWLLTATTDEQRLAIAHEREHLTARDPQLLIAACVAVAVLPWHPATWWMLARLRLAVEMDCDRRVLAGGAARRLYGTTLIDIAARGARLPLGVPALADHTTHLERRLIAMTPAPATHRRSRVLAGAAATVLTVAAACEARLPSSPEIERMDVKAVENNAMAKVALAGDTSITYFVDGRQVTALASREIPADSIAAISIAKGSDQREIHITTLAAARTTEASSGGTVQPLRREGTLDRTAAGALELAPAESKVRVPLMRDSFAGLVVIDGVISNQETLSRLSPDAIQSIDVLKGEAARRVYSHPAAANGVIRVTTKP